MPYLEPSLSKPAHDELQCWKTKTESTLQERKGFSKGFTGKLANNFFIVGKAKRLCYLSNHRSTSFSFSFGLQVHKVMRKTENYNIILFCRILNIILLILILSQLIKFNMLSQKWMHLIYYSTFRRINIFSYKVNSTKMFKCKVD